MWSQRVNCDNKSIISLSIKKKKEDNKIIKSTINKDFTDYLKD